MKKLFFTLTLISCTLLTSCTLLFGTENHLITHQRLSEMLDLEYFDNHFDNWEFSNPHQLRYIEHDELNQTFVSISYKFESDDVFVSISFDDELYILNTFSHDFYIYDLLSERITQYFLEEPLENIYQLITFIEDRREIVFLLIDWQINDIIREIVIEESSYISYYARLKGFKGSNKFSLIIDFQTMNEFPLLDRAVTQYFNYITPENETLTIELFLWSRSSHVHGFELVYSMNNDLLENFHIGQSAEFWDSIRPQYDYINNVIDQI